MQTGPRGGGARPRARGRVLRIWDVENPGENVENRKK